ncbi:hypothetical protein E8E01_00365 [Methylorubrum populi]|uniref:hypothetical protein n=1 Tax=Methylorubrum populi TaxID=223967 RepID=UPI00115151EF|nr:hypothetical protein [Methylorubrum populi]QDI79009.1 hypothetical protein E8E01_00365 [Methylorubrum populi]
MSSVGQDLPIDYDRMREEHAQDDYYRAQQRALLAEQGLPVPENGVPEIAEERIDMAALWRSLSEAERETVGLIGLGFVLSGTAACEAEATAPAAYRAYLAHYNAVERDLGMLPAPEGVLAALRGPSWKLPAELGPVCRKCGCSEDDACAGGCGWEDARQIRCTACASRPSYDRDDDIPF